MHRRIALLLLASASLSFASTPPEQDRRAILAMAGNFKVSFNFEETFPVARQRDCCPPHDNRHCAADHPK